MSFRCNALDRDQTTRALIKLFYAHPSNQAPARPRAGRRMGGGTPFRRQCAWRAAASSTPMSTSSSCAHDRRSARRWHRRSARRCSCRNATQAPQAAQTAVIPPLQTLQPLQPHSLLIARTRRPRCPPKYHLFSAATATAAFRFMTGTRCPRMQCCWRIVLIPCTSGLLPCIPRGILLQAHCSLPWARPASGQSSIRRRLIRT